VGEVALALILLVAAGLLMKSFARLAAVDPGYDAANVMTVEINLPTTRYSPQLAAAFRNEVLERLAGPRVEAAAFTGTLPLTPGEMVAAFRPEGRINAADARPVTANVRVVTEDYARVMGIPLVEGRMLAPTDDDSRQGAVLVNEAFVRAYYPGQSILGRSLPVFANPGEVVGVLGDVRHSGLDAEPRPEIYVSSRQMTQPGGGERFLVVRTVGDPLAIVPQIRTIVQSIDPAIPLSTVMTMEARVAASIAHPRFYALTVGMFGALAVLLATLGVYSVISYGVVQRTREVGVRMALGASRAAILRLLLSQGARLVLIGIALGLLGAVAASRSLGGLLFGVTPGDITVYASVTLALASVAIVACYLPARRATRIHPTEALRHD
jgi:putative ABC transport system permease protein